MSKENKYYTPEIEEFHVGFKYEVKMWNAPDVAIEDWAEYIKTDEAEKKVIWVSQIWNNQSSFTDLMNVADDGDGNIVSITVPDSIRVKHLDREDIESLGFAYQISSWDREDNSKSCVKLESPMMDGSMQFEKVIGEQSVFQIIFDSDLIKIIHATLSENSFGLMMAEPNKEAKEIQKSKKLMVFNLLFKGKIKNKSELKKVLLMIGVVE